jgi:predicted nucleic acid-binding protein
MIHACDADILLMLFMPDVPAPLDPKTQKPVDRAKERIENLIETLDTERKKIIIPTPALSEFLARAGVAAPKILDNLNDSARFKIVPFDERAAVEAAASTYEAHQAGDKRGGSQSSWSKIKFDRQIVAIAKVENAEVIYSDDDDVRRFAKKCGIRVIGVSELPLPPPKQTEMKYDGTEGEAPDLIPPHRKTRPS